MRCFYLRSKQSIIKFSILTIYVLFILFFSLYLITKFNVLVMSTKNASLILFHPIPIMLILGITIGLHSLLFNLDLNKKIFIRRSTRNILTTLGIILTIFTGIISLKVFPLYIYILIYILWFLIGFFVSRSIQRYYLGS